jgi:DNA polymerase elongation subunit (family B)
MPGEKDAALKLLQLRGRLTMSQETLNLPEKGTRVRHESGVEFVVVARGRKDGVIHLFDGAIADPNANHYPLEECTPVVPDPTPVVEPEVKAPTPGPAKEIDPDGPQPLPLKDDRFPGLWFEFANPDAKKKDHDYSDRIVADDRLFDIFKVPNQEFLKETSIRLHEVASFVDYTNGVAFLDCEWVGSDGGQAKGDNNDVLVAIGLKCRGRHYTACKKNKTEAELLQWFFTQLLALNVHTIAGYASYGFFRDDKDIPVDFAMIYLMATDRKISKTEIELLRWFFAQPKVLIHTIVGETKAVPVDFAMIYNRARHHKIPGCPWKPKKGKFSTHRWNNAIVFGKPLEVPAWECQQYELIDIYPQIVLYDSLVRVLDNYKLKDSVIGFKLRADRRIEIGHEIYEFWARGETDTITEYLNYDLDDTELLWNFLIPQKYFMKAYLPMTLQRITTTGGGSWWNQYLISATGDRPQKTATCGYQGALTYYHAGCYRNCVKMDFSGLYPSIMLTWLIASCKDPGLLSLQTLQFLIKYRKEIKNTDAYKRFDSGIVDAEGIDAEGIDADGRQHTAKILANILYGMLNTTGLPFNDPYAGAAVTAYGRNLARHMISWLSDRGVETIGLDTDGAVIRLVDDHYSDEERTARFTELCKELNATLPGVTYVDFEAEIPFIYIPPNVKGTKQAAIKLADKLNSIDCYENVTPDMVDPGLSKNYIYFTRKADGSYKLANKGKFKKRDKSWLASGFVIELITKLFYDGEDVAAAYARSVREEIASGSIPLSKLQKTVLVAANWKEFPKHGFPVGTKPTVHYVWRGETTGKRVIKKVFVPSDKPEEPYAPEYYLEQFDEILAETPIKLEEVPEAVESVEPDVGQGEQLALLDIAA